MTDDDACAAMERLRKYRAGEKLGDTTDLFLYEKEYGGEYRDMKTLADAYLAEHPADSELPIDEDWLRSVGFKWNEADGNFHNQRWEMGRLGLWEFNDTGEWILWNILDSFSVRTRGQLRLLCRALGVPLTE